MSRPKNPVPTYRLHKQSGQAIVTVPLNGSRKDILLGRYGSPESQQEYQRVLSDLASGRLFAHAPADLTIHELAAKFWEWAEVYYRHPDGTISAELADLKHAFGPLRDLFGHSPAREFGPLAFKRVRDAMIAKGWARTTINQQSQRVKRLIRWGVENELLPADRWEALRAVRGLSKGRTNAPEPIPVGPVDDEHVDAVLPFVTRHVRGLIEFQRLTGCRPGEACRLRRSEIDMGGAVWLYRPVKHKTAHRGKTRTIAIGPKAQAMLREFFTPSIEDFLFSPARAMEERRAERAENRKTPRYPSHIRRNAAKRVESPKRVPHERYTVVAYNRAIVRGIELANRERERQSRNRLEDGGAEPLGSEGKATWTPVPHWHVNQLRHTYATRVRREHGLEAAATLLGHSSPDTTLIYAEADTALAAGVALKIG